MRYIPSHDPGSAEDSPAEDATKVASSG
jgi:hypothetical protein